MSTLRQLYVKSVGSSGVPITATPDNWGGNTNYQYSSSQSGALSIVLSAPSSRVVSGQTHYLVSPSPVYISALEGESFNETITFYYSDDPDGGWGQLESVVDFPDLPAEGEAEFLSAYFSPLTASDVATLLSVVESRGPDLGLVLGGQSGMISSISIPIVSGSFGGASSLAWSILKDISLSSKIKVQSMKFSSHEELTNMRDVFNIPNTDPYAPEGMPAMLYSLTSSLPDLAKVGRDISGPSIMGLSPSEWGE